MPRKKQEALVVKDTQDVLAYRVGELEKSQAAGFARIDAKLDSIGQGFVTVNQLNIAQKNADDKHGEQDRRITRLEEWNTWAQRLVLGAVITGIIGTVAVIKL